MLAKEAKVVESVTEGDGDFVEGGRQEEERDEREMKRRDSGE